MIKYIYHRKNLFLFCTLILLLLAHPYMENGLAGEFFLVVIVSCILVTTCFALSHRPPLMYVAIFLGLPPIVFNLVNIFSLWNPAKWAYLITNPLFYIFATITILRDVLKGQTVTSEKLFGVVSVYIMLAIAWSTIYLLLVTIYPTCFRVTVPHLENYTLLHWSDTLYFSFCTLTTLGFGDIVPVTPQARSLCSIEAITGVLFVAVLVARLAGLYRPISKSAP